jgi:hypothetical protein
MLLPSILRILDQDQHELRIAEQAKARMPVSKPEEASGLQRIELEIAAAADLVKPSDATPEPAGTVSAGPFLGELLRAITKFEKSDQSRVVDVFE